MPGRRPAAGSEIAARPPPGRRQEGVTGRGGVCQGGRVTTTTSGITSALTGTAAAYQIALAAGAPWGAASWGGLHLGVLPPGFRVAGAGAAALLGTAAVSAATPDPSTARRCAHAALAAWMALGSVGNALSPSRVEQVLWTPVNAALAVGFWRLSRR